MADRETPTPLLCLDLGGTVRHGKDQLGRFVNTADAVIVFPEAVELMRRWKQGDGRIIGVSNQGGIALGHITFAACAAAMMRTQMLTGKLFDKLAWCSGAPGDVEWARGPQGVFSLPTGEADDGIPDGKDGGRSAALMVSTMRH